MLLSEPLYWNYMKSSATWRGARPSATSGVSLTAGLNTKGSWVRLIDAPDYDCDLLELVIFSTGQSGNARSTIIDIGVDIAGGTSYSVYMADMEVSNAGNIAACLQIRQIIPIFIPAGATVAIRGQQANATAAASFRAAAAVWGRPNFPVKRNGFFRTYGVDVANSRGTAITAGTTSEGAWTELGTIASGETINAFGVALSDYSGSISSAVHFLDLAVGDATFKDIVMEDVAVSCGSAETFSYTVDGRCTTGRKGYAGEKVYGRVQTSLAAAPSNLFMSAWGVG